MDWHYFRNDNGNLRIKRLPISPRGSTVVFKDVTDFDMFRDEHREARQEFASKDQAFQHAYAICFQEPYDYEVEVEDFWEVFEKNRNRFLGDLRGLRHEIETIEHLLDWDAADGKLFLAPKLAQNLIDAGIASLSSEVDEACWKEYLTETNNVAHLKEIAKDAGIKVKGRKAEIVHQLYEAIQQGQLSYPEPRPIEPGPNLKSWLKELEGAYMTALEEALDQWPYPEPFRQCVLEEGASMLPSSFESSRSIATSAASYTSTEDDSAFTMPAVSFHVETDPDLSTSKLLGKTSMVLDHVPVTFDYVDADGKQTTRTVHVRRIEKGDYGYLYLKGYCQLRGDERTFRLDRMGSLTNKASGKHRKARNIIGIHELYEFLGGASISGAYTMETVRFPWVGFILTSAIVFTILWLIYRSVMGS